MGCGVTRISTETCKNLGKENRYNDDAIPITRARWLSKPNVNKRIGLHGDIHTQSRDRQLTDPQTQESRSKTWLQGIMMLAARDDGGDIYIYT